ncbi:MAG: ABC transporter substrate binding protein [Pseudomonadota bacterium]
MELWFGAVNLGFFYAFMAMGVFITFRVFDFPDITVDGSFTAGAGAAAVLISAGFHPVPSLGAAFVIGGAAGYTTGLIHTRLNINGLLAGILVMTGLYSINLHIMGRSNIPLLNQTTLVTILEDLNPGLPNEIWLCSCLAVIMTVFWGVLSRFFRTDFGLAMRITGNNPIMAGANGVNVNRMKIFGIALANGLVGVSGGLVAQYQGFADIGMGIGTVVIGLASVIIGEAVLRKRSIAVKVLSVFVGSILFRLMIAFALFIGMNPLDLKLLTAAFVLLTLIVSKLISGKQGGSGTAASLTKQFLTGKRLVAVAAVAVVLIAAFSGLRLLGRAPSGTPKMPRIGVVQVTEHNMLNITRDTFLDEMKQLGYREGESCRFFLENANGELSMVDAILDKFIAGDMDVIVTISTACTQAAINKIKDRPVVFATVANPFIIGAGRTDADHLPNVTGVYGLTPMSESLKMLRRIIPGKIKIASIWDPAQANSVVNVENLRKAVDRDEGVAFTGATITNSSEVYQAALTLVNKGIDAFVLSPDNTVYSAFESVVKAARSKKIPIAISDVERLQDGALLAYGYDCSISGRQAAHLVDRILKGESPEKIPFEQYKKITFGVNLRIAEELGLEIPEDILAKTTVMVGKDGVLVENETERKDNKAVAPGAGPAPGKGKKLALFIFNASALLMETADGVRDELKASGVLDKYGITIDMKNAQNEFPTAQAVVQDIVRMGYDYIITISTPALQVAANGNKKIPHIFGAVTDPYRMGIAAGNKDHIPNITGVATLQPVEATVRTMREVFPGAKKIGLVWNPGEACSEACTYKARDAAKKYGFELLEATVSSTNEVLDAVKALLNKGVDLFLTSGDNTVNLAVPSLAEILRQRKIPYFNNTPSDVDQGVFIAIGADYYEVGRETARQAIMVINGKNPQDIPIKDYVPEKLAINLKMARHYGITVPEAILDRAEKVVK